MHLLSSLCKAKEGAAIIGSVDLCCANFVRDKRVLIEARRMWLSNLSKRGGTTSKTRLAEPFRQRLFVIYAVLSPTYLGMLNCVDAALPKSQTIRCKNAQQSSTDPIVHDDYQAAVQRLFISLQPESYVRPHRHSKSEKWEFFLMIEGALSFLLFDDSGVCSQRYELNAHGPLRGLEIPSNTWHCVVAEQAATFFEVKQGPYVVTEDKDFAAWAPKEGHANVPAFLERLKNLKSGQKVGA